jgi:hypothetical protein
MKDIVFNGFYLKKCTYWLLGLGLITFALVFTMLNVPREDRFIWGASLIGLEAYFVFYLNRFEPKVIRLHKENFEIMYRNYKFFEKADRVYLKNDTKVVAKRDMLILSNNNSIVGKVRKKELTYEDWRTITNYFV